MKKQAFKLSGILKVRKHKEIIALQKFMKKTQRDRTLINEQELLRADIEQTMDLMYGERKSALDVEQMRYASEYINACSFKKQRVQKEREKIQDSVVHARNEYNKVRLELESIKILEDKHNNEQKKIQRKNFYKQMQEGVIL